MGQPVVFVYSDKGVNQEIKFCCPMCKPKFLAVPDKYMKIIKDVEGAEKIVATGIIPAKIKLDCEEVHRHFVQLVAGMDAFRTRVCGGIGVADLSESHGR